MKRNECVVCGKTPITDTYFYFLGARLRAINVCSPECLSTLLGVPNERRTQPARPATSNDGEDDPNDILRDLL